MAETTNDKPSIEMMLDLVKRAENLRARNPDEFQGYTLELLAVMGVRVVELHNRVEALEAELAKLKAK